MEEKKDNKEEIKEVVAEKAKSGSSVVDKFSGYIAAFLIGAGAAGGLCWYTMSYTQRDVNSVGKDFVVTKECREILEKNGGVSDENALREAIKSYVSSAANDNYTFYYEDDAVEENMKYVNASSTARISGFQVAPSDDGNILLTEVIEGMPAYNQGLRVNDVITSIDGNSVSEGGFENTANKMLGKDGTKVTFTVQRDGQTLDIEFVRASVIDRSVNYEQLGEVAYISISSFNQLAKGQLEQALKSAEGQKKIVFDVRNNGGGDTEAGVYMSAQCCGHSECVQTDYSGKENVIQSDYDVDTSGCNIVVLINESTASAAELFTASMKSNANAKLIGTNTYGKGTYQREAVLSNGGHLHYTAGSFTVEGWDNWEGIGIAPDVEVPMDKELIGTDNDIQLKKAIALLE